MWDTKCLRFFGLTVRGSETESCCALSQLSILVCALCRSRIAARPAAPRLSISLSGKLFGKLSSLPFNSSPLSQSFSACSGCGKRQTERLQTNKARARERINARHAVGVEFPQTQPELSLAAPAGGKGLCEGLCTDSGTFRVKGATGDRTSRTISERSNGPGSDVSQRIMR